MIRLLLVSLCLAPAVAFAEDEVDLGVEETRFEVVSKESATKLDAHAPDEPATLEAEPPHPYLDPFLGREVVPEVAAQLSLVFAQQKNANAGEPGGKDGRIALGGRADLSLWILDVRVPFDTEDDTPDGPVEVVLKAPFSIGVHRFAPMLIAHVPPDRGFDDAVFELAFGYHLALGGFALKLEVSGFSATHARTKGEQSAGMMGWNAAASYLIGGVVGIVIEAAGTTAISERVESRPPAVGDTVVRVAPGLRFFPLADQPGFCLGLAGLFTRVPNGYAALSRDQGVLFDISYTFL